MMIESPLRLDHLDDKQAVFTGTATETVETSSMLGRMETEYKWPTLLISREVWEALGAPTHLAMIADTPSAVREALIG